MTESRTASQYLPDDELDLALLNRLRLDAAPATSTIDAVRRRVHAEFADHKQIAQPKPKHFVTKPRLAIAASVVLLAVLTPALAGQLWPTQGATAQAAVLLNSAADQTIHSVDADMSPGQWLEVTKTGQYQNIGGESDQSTQQARFWVPYDRSGDWYLHRDEQGTKTPDIIAAQGMFYGPTSGNWGSPTESFLASLPRDTDQLRARLYADAYGGHSTDGEAVVYVADLMRSGVVPADLRAALYRVLATIPGVQVFDEETTLNGEKGVAFGRTEDSISELQLLIIDPATGLFIGEKYVIDGTVTGIASLRYRVVDEVPPEVTSAAQRTYWK